MYVNDVGRSRRTLKAKRSAYEVLVRKCEGEKCTWNS